MPFLHFVRSLKQQMANLRGKLSARNYWRGRVNTGSLGWEQTRKLLSQENVSYFVSAASVPSNNIPRTAKISVETSGNKSGVCPRAVTPSS
jgi:hypothetical protein